MTHPEGFTLAGTLTIPDSSTHGPGPYPAAVLISGSGQQDRDEAIMGHKPFLVLADHLVQSCAKRAMCETPGAGSVAVDPDTSFDAVRYSTRFAGLVIQRILAAVAFVLLTLDVSASLAEDVLLEIEYRDEGGEVRLLNDDEVLGTIKDPESVLHYI